MNRLFTRPEAKSAAAFVALALPLCLFAWLFSAILIPLLLATILYVLLDPLVNAMHRAGLPRRLAVGSVLFLMVVIGVWIAIAVAPFIGEQFATFQAALPETWQNLTSLLNRFEHYLAGALGISFEGKSLLSHFEGFLRGFSDRAIGQASGLVADIAMWLFLVPFVTFFLLRDYRSLRNRVIKSVPNRVFEEFLKLYHQVTSQLESYIRGVMLQSIIMAVVVSIGFTVVGLPMAPLLGVMAGVLNLIPYVGPLLSFLPPTLVSLSLGIDPDMLIGIAVVLLLAQLTDNLIVVPTILARAANLHPLVALLSIIVAGNLFGLPGMVLALPTLASARIIYAGLLSGFRHTIAPTPT